MGLGKDLGELYAEPVNVAEVQRAKVITEWMVQERLVCTKRYESSTSGRFPSFADHVENSSFINWIRLIQ